MSMNLSEQETLEFALSMGMNPDTSEPLTADERTTIEQLKGGSGVSLGTVNGTEGAQSVAPVEGADPMQAQLDAINAQLAALQQGQQGAGTQQYTFEDILKQIDPRDSDASLAMFQWLVDNGRLTSIGTLSRGGYLLHYSEPKGTSKAGYTPGGTQGGRMVDKAVEDLKEAGAKPIKRGLCTKCFSAVVQEDDGTVALDDTSANTVCSAGGTHDFHG